MWLAGRISAPQKTFGGTTSTMQYDSKYSNNERNMGTTLVTGVAKNKPINIL